jgi:hypothetical protein
MPAENRFHFSSSRSSVPRHWRSCGVAPDADARFALGPRIPDEILRHLDVADTEFVAGNRVSVCRAITPLQPAISQIPWQEPRLVQH